MIEIINGYALVINQLTMAKKNLGEINLSTIPDSILYRRTQIWNDKR